MKKILYIFATGIALTACTADEPLQEISSPSTTSQTSSDLRTTAEILEIASNASELITPNGQEKGLSKGFGRVIDYSTPIMPIGRNGSRAADNEALMYVVNYADDNGFSMISAHRNAPELLAVTQKGHYDPSKKTDIYGFNLWMEETLQMLECSELEHQKLLETYAGKTIKTVTDTLEYRFVPNRINVAWGQMSEESYEDACEGLDCPNGISGCANTAIAMAMAFLERPDYLTLTYKKDPATQKNKTLRFRWQEIKKYLAKPNPQDNMWPIASEDPKLDAKYGPYNIRESITELFRQIGIDTKSDYTNPKVTTTFHNDAFMAMHQYALTSASGWEKGAGLECFNTLFNNTSCILLVSGKDPAYDIAHIWVCDGLHNYQIRKRILESTDGGKTWNTTQTTLEKEYCLVNYNWGMHGKYDGYYLYTDTKVLKDDIILRDFTEERMILKVIQ